MIHTIARTKMLSLVMAVMLVILGSVSSGFASYRHHTYYRHHHHHHSKTKGAVVGGIIGTVGGALVGGKTGAVVGAGAGAGTGYLVQKHRNTHHHE